MGGCGLFIIDHDENSVTFCEGTEDLLDPGRIDEAGGTYSEDQAVFWSDELSNFMRFAEDATRDLRSKARALADAYDDAREIADEDTVDDVSQEESDETFDELRRTRAEARTACAAILEAAPDDEPDATEE